MLTIERDQYDQLVRLQSQRFVEKLVRFLERSYGDQLGPISGATCRGVALRVLHEGPIWGFETEAELAELSMLLVEMRLAYGPTLSIPAWFTKVVEDSSLNPQAKLHQLVYHWANEIEPIQVASTAASAVGPVGARTSFDTKQ